MSAGLATPVTALVNAPAVRLDLACGAQKAEGWLGIDVARAPGVDVVHDLFQFPWPVATGTVAAARCVHFVEHLPHREAPLVEITPGLRGGTIEMLPPMRWAWSVQDWGFVRDLWFDFWEEVHRVLVPGGEIAVVTPYYSHERADQDPTHERRMCERSYDYLSQAWLERNRCVYPYAADFEVVNYERICLDEAAARRARAFEHERHLNVVADLAVTLKAKKPARCWWKEPS